MILRNEYPNPSFRRKQYLNLNGEWSFDFDDDNIGLKNRYYLKDKFDKTIVVPFAYQTKESLINNKDLHPYMWYQRNFDLPKEMLNKNILLNFNFVDFECLVYLNGQFVGENKFGYVRFSFDITDYLKEKNNNLVVYVKDEYDPTNPRGKQYWEKETSRCWYYPSSGICGSVWIETYQKDYISSCLIDSNIDNNSFTLNFETLGKSNYLDVEVSYKNKVVKKITTSLHYKYHKLTIDLLADDYIDEIHYWREGSPNIYDLKLTLRNDSEICDEVETYTAFRKIEARDGYVYLNHIRLYQRLVLDQGYWENTGLTPPSIEELKKDILLSMEMGFNGARKHQKIEDPYYYYYADMLGFLVWGEIPSPYNFSFKQQEIMTPFITKIVKQLYNHPSIITWVPFNESWGVRKALNDQKTKSYLKGIYQIIKSLDNTRLVDTNDGWEVMSDSDIIAIHDYSYYGDEFATKYNLENLQTQQPTFRRLFAHDEMYQGQPLILSEYGGVSSQADVNDEFFGYFVYKTKEDVINRLRSLQLKVLEANFRGFCFTQLSDVEQETNGLLDKKHNPKFDVKILNDIFSKDKI